MIIIGDTSIKDEVGTPVIGYTDLLVSVGGEEGFNVQLHRLGTTAKWVAWEENPLIYDETHDSISS